MPGWGHYHFYLKLLQFRAMKLYSALNPQSLQKQDRRIHWGNLHGASDSLAVSQLAGGPDQGSILVITPDSQNARRLHREILFFKGNSNFTCHYLPDWETLPYDHFSPYPDLVSERLLVLSHLLKAEKTIVIAALPTLMHRFLPRDFLIKHSMALSVNDRLDIQKLRDQLIQSGYYHVKQVLEHGEFALRGSILDIFPMGSSFPFRIELFDEVIETIRKFNPETQCSVEKIEEIKLFPAREFPLTEEAITYFRQNWRSRFAGNPKDSSVYESISEAHAAPGAEYYLPLFFTKLNSIFDYLNTETQIICTEPLSIVAEKFWKDIQARYEQLRYDIQRPLCPPEEVFIPPNDFFNAMKGFGQIQFHSEILPEKMGNFSYATSKPPTLPIDHKAKNPLGNIELFLKNNAYRTLFCAETTGRREILLELFKGIKFFPEFFPSWQAFIDSKENLGICIAPLDQGLCLDNPPIAVISESQLFGEQVMQRRLRKGTRQDPNNIIRNLTELNIGSPVVHLDHGVGRYLGLDQIRAGDQEGEYLKLEYAGGDKIYVPVTSLHLISRYTGADAENAPLQKLGTKQWQTIKQKTAEKVRDVAAELLEVYSRRQAAVGYAVKEPDQSFIIFRRSFPFEETPDQTKTINDVIADMTSSRTMDRLVCGDVGFGKTEVAMQAAFLALQSGKQIAILVPTTLLAEQHLQNFKDRFANWPVQIEAFSRMQTAKNQKIAIERLEEGKIDIAIGTHKLLSPNIRFKDLGLLIIDEEHRFGVRQKERIKALRAHIDILTLTATPIPRTLNMALAGTRDLSIIATPPARRLAIKTFVHEFENGIVREAMQRELLRGGQLYFLHNDVSTIGAMAEKLQNIMPESRIGIAHGQLHERALEKVMADFYHGRFNILVCSTIIESGIDVPSANTIIINRADRFGLAQLHQLRGRVGRSHHQAYAYLLTAPEQKLTKDAEKRLEAITQLEDLGAGFQLATHDLEIRGAGELLGEEQSGHIHAVGFSLYMEMLETAVKALKAGETPVFEFSVNAGVEINLQMSAFIPEPYVPDVNARLTLYKRLANCKSVQEIQDLKGEFIDRFGLLPEVTESLFALSQLKLIAAELGITKIESAVQYGYLHFNEKPHVDPIKIINLIQQQPKNFQLQGGNILRFKLTVEKSDQRIEFFTSIMNSLR